MMTKDYLAHSFRKSKESQANGGRVKFALRILLCPNAKKWAIIAQQKDKVNKFLPPCTIWIF